MLQRVVGASKMNKHRGLSKKIVSSASSSINRVIIDLLEQNTRVETDLRVSQFAKNLDYMREKHENRKKQINHFIARMRSASINSNIPLREILQQFISSTRLGFDQEMTSEALFYISATLNSLGPNPSHYFDYNMELLKDSWKFQDLVGDFRYGLKSGVEFSPERISSSLRALKRLQYSDNKITRDAILKIHRMLIKQDNEFVIDTDNIVENNPSIHKPLYYMRQTLNAKQVVDNPDFQRYLKATLQKQEQELNKKNLESKSNEDQDAQTITLRSQLSQDELEILGEIEVIAKKINKSIHKSAVAMKKTIESVMQIRKHYLRMIESQNKVQSVNLTPLLNLDLLNLEESMIDAGLISIYEVKNPQLIEDANKNRESIASIVTNLVSGQNEGFLSYFDKLIQSQPDLIQDRENSSEYSQEIVFSPNYTHNQFADALLAITEYASQKCIETQGNTYLNEKWADFFTEVDEADRIFFISFLDSQKLFMDLAPVILQQTSIQTDVNALGMYAGAFANMGLIGVAQKLVERVKGLEGLSNKAGNNILRVCSEFPEDFRVLSEKILSKMSENECINTSEIIDTVYYQIALNRLNDVTVKQLQAQLKHSLDENPRLHFVSQYLKLQGIDLGYNSSGSSIFENTLFKQNPIKEKLIDLIGRVDNLSHIGLGDFKPDFMTLDRNEEGEIVQKAIFITSAEFSYFDIPKSAVEFSLLEKYLSQKVTNTVFQFIPITKFLDIDHKQHSIAIKKNSDIFIELIETVRKNLYSALHKDLISLGEKLIDEEYNILKQKMKQIFRLSSGRRYLQLSMSDLMQVKYLLYSLSEEYKHTLPEVRKIQLDTLCQELFQTDFVTLLKNHSKVNFTSKTSQEEMEFFLAQKWVGKRLTIDLISKSDSDVDSKTSPDVFFDHMYMSSDNYFEYSEWQDILTAEYGVSNICQLKPTNFLSQQVADACNPTSSTYMIPKKREIRSQIRPLDLHLVPSSKDRANYSLNWEKDYLFTSDKTPSYTGENSFVSTTTIYLANLLNFKWEMKMALTGEQRLSFLHDLSLTDTLIQNHLSKTPHQIPKFAHFAQRTPLKYFQHLEQKTPSSLYCQEYLEFFARKADQKNKLLQLSKLNFTQIKQMYKSYQKGYISRQQFDLQKAAIQKDLLKTLRQYDAANSSLGVLFQSETDRYIDVQYDAESLLKDKTFVRYNIEGDKDYHMSHKDLNQCLNLKRVRAEEKIIKMKILSKISMDKTLTSLESQYLAKWSQDELVLPKQPTFMTYKELSPKDTNSLKEFRFSDLSSFEKMQVNDLVFELASFFEQAIVNNADIHMKGQTALKEWGISPELVSKSATSSVNNYLIAMSETEAWREGQQLQQHEKDNIREILRILKEESFNDKIVTAREDVLRQKALEVFNLSENRFSIFLKWLESRDQEEFRSMPDNTQEIMALWESIFGTKYDSTSQDDLHLFTHNLVQRLFVLSKYPPVSFGSLLAKLLLHPKLHIIDKNMLICGIDAFKFNAYLSSKELIEFSQNVRAAHPPKDLAALTRANVFTTDNILKKLAKITQN